MECLRQSYLNARILFGDEVDFFVCYNTMPMLHPVLKEMALMGVTLVDATLLIVDWLGDDGTRMTTGDQRSGWVFAPLQNDLNRKELILDNDILIIKREPFVDDWLFGDDDQWFFMHHWRYADKSKRSRRSLCFGLLQGIVPPGVPRIDGGMVGVPPGDRMPEVEAVIKQYGLTADMFTDHRWEQAVLALIYWSMRDRALLGSFELVPRAMKSDFEIFKTTWAIHLSGLNQLQKGVWTPERYKDFVRLFIL
jgi:hypothetical protein